MNQLINDIDISVDMIKNDTTYKNKNYTPIILFSNENGQGKNEIINFNNKTVLCPIASGDQYLNAKFYDAKEIVTYDINRLAKYIFDLKIASIKGLDYEEFFLFMVPYILGRKNEYFLSEKLMKKVIPYLDKNNITYWKEIISHASKYGYNSLIQLDNESYKENELKSECLFYSNHQSYYELKNKLIANSAYELILSDIRDLKISKSFDIIDLSNIISTLIIQTFYNDNVDYSLEYLNKLYVDFIDEHILPLVNENGTILVDYQLAKNKSLDNLYFNSEKYILHQIRSKKENNIDIILKYKKS